jgi:hypothetical protein
MISIIASLGYPRHGDITTAEFMSVIRKSTTLTKPNESTEFGFNNDLSALISMESAPEIIADNTTGFLLTIVAMPVLYAYDVGMFALESLVYDSCRLSTTFEYYRELIVDTLKTQTGAIVIAEVPNHVYFKFMVFREDRAPTVIVMVGPSVIIRVGSVETKFEVTSPKFREGFSMCLQSLLE